MNSAGFNRDGSSPPSITNVITAEIEAARSLALGCQIISSLDRKEYERDGLGRLGRKLEHHLSHHHLIIWALSETKSLWLYPLHTLGNLTPSYLLWQVDTLGRGDDDWINMVLTLQLIHYPVVDSGQSTTVFSLLCSR